MRKLYALMFAALFLTCIAGAHPASGIKLSYNNAEGVLRVSVAHSVKDAGSHYLSKITVSINGEEAVLHRLKGQNSDEGLELRYYLPGMKKGDKITVTAVCNKFGSKKASLKID